MKYKIPTSKKATVNLYCNEHALLIRHYSIIANTKACPMAIGRNLVSASHGCFGSIHILISVIAIAWLVPYLIDKVI
jgi:hypothetical protein